MPRFRSERTEPKGNTTEEEFAQLVAWLERDTRHSSRTKDAMDHPAFAAIVALGRAVLPLLVERVREDVGKWIGIGWWEFPAMSAIAGSSPNIPEDARGRLPMIAAIYLEWAATNGFDREQEQR